MIRTGQNYLESLRDEREIWIDGERVNEVPAAQRGLANWFGTYNAARPHQGLGYATPGELYHSPESYGARPPAWR